MNTEIYSIRNNREETQSLNKSLPSLIEKMKEDGVHILYKTEMDLDREKLLEGIHQSLSSKDQIHTIVIANALDGKEDNPVFMTLCGLCAGGITPEKERLEQLRRESLPDLVMAMDYPEPESDSAQKQEDGAAGYANALKISNMGNGYDGYCFFYQDKKMILLPRESLAGVPCAELIKQGIYFSLSARPLLPEQLKTDGIAFLSAGSDEKQKSKKKKGFWAGIIPMKGDGAKEVFRKIILILAVLTFLVAGGYLFNYLVIQPWLNDKSNEEIQNIFYNSPEEPATEIDSDGTVVVKPRHNWDDIKKINDEIVGWIKMDDTQYLDYPVLQSKDDTIDYQKYLYADYKGNYSGYGSLFIDFRSDKGTDSKNIIIHGHHMNDGRMFAELMGYGTYSGNLDYYKKHPVIHFDTPEGDADWKVISVYKTSTLESHGEYFDYLTGSFTSDAEFMNYVYLIKERSLIDTPVDINEDDQLLTLSTCSYEFSEFRTVVVARKVRDGEKSTVDLEKAALNPDPLWPDVYYNTYGGQKPEVTSFKTAYKAGEISWYDGKGNLKGKERPFTLFDSVEVKDETEPTQAPTSPPATKPAEIKANNIYFDYSAMTLNVGNVERLSAIWDPANTTNKSLTWYTSDANVVTIRSTGELTATGPGKAVISAESANGRKTTCDITVIQPVENISLDWSGYNAQAGTSFSLQCTVTPSNASYPAVSWKSSNTNVATVDANGRVTAKSAGSATITATASNGMAASCNVTVFAAPVQQAPEATQALDQ